MKQNPLYVPIILDALVVGENSNRFAQLTPDFKQLRDTPLASSTMVQYFQTTNQKAGIHLHWTMPDALLHGEQKDTIEFPQLPNRWIVQRVQYKDNSIERVAWIIESDFINNIPKTMYGMNKTSIPTLKQVNGEWVGAGIKGEVYGYLGDCRVYGTDKLNDGYYLDKLTGVGAGDVTFAAFYPKCQTVFGFYDPVQDCSDGKFTYNVAGYYEDADKDPLSSNTEDTLEKYAWIYTDSTEMPDSTICHGCVKGVVWKGKDVIYDTSIPQETVDLAIGNTSVEALSALIQDNMHEVEGLERILNAMQYNLLTMLDDDNPDALIEFEELLHEKQFSSEIYGYKWVVRKKDDADADCEGLSFDLCLLINQLNNLQTQVDKRIAQNRAIINDIYFCWWKYIMTVTDPLAATEAGNTEKRESLRKYANKEELISNINDDIKMYLTTIQSMLKQISSNNQLISAYINEINSKENDIGIKLAKVHLFIEKIETNRCYIGNPPVVLLSGAGLKRGFKQGTQTDNEGHLRCRRNTIYNIPVTVNKKLLIITWEDALFLCTDTKTTLPKQVQQLLAETILLDINATRALAILALNKADDARSDDYLQAVIDQISDTQTKISAQAIAPYPFSNKYWSQPWNPMLMEWRVNITPASDNLTNDDSFKEFSLGDIDLDYNKANAFCSLNKWAIQGTTLILPHAAVNLYDMLNKLIEDYGDEEQDYGDLKSVIARLKTTNLLSQQLDGFNEALLMQDKWPFLPAFGCDCSDAEFSLEDLNRYMDNYITSPRVETENVKFMPIRAGRMELEKLWVVDSFGQIKIVTIDKARIHIAESMSIQDNKAGVLLRPRFMQPCTMSFNWKYYKDETIEAIDSQTTPVFGYIIPNFIDYNLQVYDSEGEMLGLIQSSDNGSKWMSSFGTCKDYKDIECEHLKNFVEGIVEGNPKALSDFLVCLDKSFNSILPANENPFFQLCFGKVLVLARAAIKIFQKGNNAHVQLWDKFEECNNYDVEKFSIKIGDIRKLEDGLIGFYTGSATGDTYKHIYCCLDESVGTSGYLINGNIIEASLKDDPIELTMLLNPAGDITIRTGFLPTKKIQFSNQFYEKQFEKLQYLLRTMPVLVQPNQFSMLMPGNMEDTWSFFYKDTKDTLTQISKTNPLTQKLPDEKQTIWEGFLKAAPNKHN